MTGRQYRSSGICDEIESERVLRYLTIKIFVQEPNEYLRLGMQDRDPEGNETRD